LTISNSTLSRNKAVACGGAVAAGAGANVVILDSLLKHNVASCGGGLLVYSELGTQQHGNVTHATSQSASVAVTNTSFLANCVIGGIRYGILAGLYADKGRRGAVEAVGSSLKLTSSTFQLNTAAAGGALSSVAGSVSLNGCWLQRNLASNNGGALAVWKGLAHTMNGTNVTGNSAEVRPAGVHLLVLTVVAKH
jgi:hypothetical protein